MPGFPPIEIDNLPPIPRLLSTILAVVAAADDPLPGDALVKGVLDRLAGQPGNAEGIAEAAISMCAAGWLIRAPANPTAARHHYALGPLARLLEIDDWHELAFVVGRVGPPTGACPRLASSNAYG